MTLVFNILAKFNISSEQLEEITPASLFLFAIWLVGLTIMLKWVVDTHFGKTALPQIHRRRNRMSFYTPLIPFAVWLLSGLAFAYMIASYESSLSDYHQELLKLFLSLVISILILILCVFIIRRNFVRGFKGIGFRTGSILKDFAMGLARIIVLFPLISLTLLVTVAVGQYITGNPEWTIDRHQGLEMLEKYPQLSMKIILIVLSVVIAPVLEEILFRGLFQTMMRNFVSNPWFAIFATSILFAMAHDNPLHWPTIFVLSAGLGYAYEKSNSLWQSIFMHTLFNAVSVIGTLYLAQ